MTHGLPDDTWDVFLPDVQLGINTAVHDITKRTPSEILFGRRVGNPTQGILNSICDEVAGNDKSENIEEIRNEASKLIERNQQKNKDRFDKCRKKVTQY